MTAWLETLAGIVGPRHLMTDPDQLAPHCLDWRQRYQGRAVALARPGCTAEVAALVRACVAAGVPMVPQGGNTSHCGAATPDDSGHALIIQLNRMHALRAVDADNNTLTAEAGCTLAQVQDATAGVGRLFPLSLASEGSCQIGGNLATNAGGVAVLRYGPMRELTLGLEAVLPDGSVLESLSGLRKNNTGYDLKQLLIGAEGTLGIITAATLKLFPAPEATATALVEVASPADALALLHALQARFGDRLTAFELMSGLCLQLLARHLPDARPPFTPPWCVLLELNDGGDEAVLNQALAETLCTLRPQADAVLARHARERAQLWALREQISEAQKRDGPSIKHDIAVPLSQLARFIERADAALQQAFPGCRVVCFGHVGDGNLHYNVSFTRPGNVDLFDDEPAVNTLVYDLVYAHGGTLSAEHGIGQLKRDWLRRYLPPANLAAMRAVKQALDPLGLMNPGKVL
ncbi:hydroxyacid dehydrogenase [Aquaspirillum sp. LM1]|uniref:FAD-binding oxidoreductase n=1 Tax=Aquaspirillum sp. LM1 TaxID=1938604 RepID=UPI000983FDC0|nr:FAD-binding oxidoreductase [Aquaspirillum sp. LM1]AQR65704.1 hydroxyacid dehydrogenase [Aquaspirillum sp. LM1]